LTQSTTVASVRTSATGRSSWQLLQQLGEQDRLVTDRTGEGDAEPSGEAVAALTALLVEEPLAAVAAFVKDVETVGVAWQGRDHGPLTTSAEGALPTGGVAVRPGATAVLVLVAAEQADA
jgi:hypothetical protein